MAKGDRGGKSSGTGNSTFNRNSVISEESIITHQGDDAEVAEVFKVQSYIAKEYGPAANARIVLGSLRGRASSVILGYQYGDTVGINIKDFNNRIMDRKYDDTVSVGFHPPRGRKSGIEAVAAHEFGHYVTKLLLRFDGKTSMSDIVNEATQKTGHRNGESLKQRISKYARRSDGEAIAEAVSDVYCNGENAAKESQRIVEILKRMAGK